MKRRFQKLILLRAMLEQKSVRGKNSCLLMFINNLLNCGAETNNHQPNSKHQTYYIALLFNDG